MQRRSRQKARQGPKCRMPESVARLCTPESAQVVAAGIASLRMGCPFSAGRWGATGTARVQVPVYLQGHAPAVPQLRQDARPLPVRKGALGSAERPRCPGNFKLQTRPAIPGRESPLGIQ